MKPDFKKYSRRLLEAQIISIEKKLSKDPNDPDLQEWHDELKAEMQRRLKEGS